MCKPDSRPNGRPEYYVSECPDTKRQFLVEHGKDNNMCELTMENAETIRRLFTVTDTPTGNARRSSDLYDGIADEYKRYQTEILPLYPDETDITNVGDYTAFDDERTTFLESLWDVISQHFDDKTGTNDNGETQEDKTTTTC